MQAAPVTRVLVTGDWHGNADFARRSFEAAEANGCQAMLQLGDFGLWPGREDLWLDHVAALARAHRTDFVWIDGNHENHDLLDTWRAEWQGDAPLAVRPHVRWAWRGSRWEWGGARFGALGGAVSIDRFLRRRHVNWWPQEAPTAADLERLGAGPLDVLATHDMPAAAATGPIRRLPLPPEIIRDAREVRALLDVAVGRTAPRLVLHGHHHVRRRVELAGWVVEGLAHDKSKGTDGWGVLDLAELSSHGGPPALRTPVDPGPAPRHPAP